MGAVPYEHGQIEKRSRGSRRCREAMRECVTGFEARSCVHRKLNVWLVWIEVRELYDKCARTLEQVRLRLEKQLYVSYRANPCRRIHVSYTKRRDSKRGLHSPLPLSSSRVYT